MSIMKPLSVTIVAVLLLCRCGVAQTAQQIFERATAALRTADYASAEAGFSRVLKVEPANVDAMGNLGVVYSRTLRYARAIEIYKQALSLRPREKGILLNLGLVYLQQDDYARAQPYFRRLHRLDPKNRRAVNLLATCLVYGGQPAKSLELLKPLADRDPDPATLYLLGVAYSRSGQVEAGEHVFAKLLTQA